MHVILMSIKIWMYQFKENLIQGYMIYIHDMNLQAHLLKREDIRLNIIQRMVTRGVATCELLTDVYLTLHICPEDQSLVNVIYEALKHPREYLSLGRREDLVRIDEVKIVDLKEKEVEVKSLDKDYNYYISSDLINRDELETKATIYTLNKVYKKVQIRKGVEIRNWEKCKVAYCSGEKNTLEDTEVLFDDDNKIVCLI